MRAIIIITIAFLAAACSSDKGKAESMDNGPEKDAPVKETIAEEKSGTGLPADMSDHPGHALYRQHCLPCHQADGNGVPGMFPGLRDTDWVTGDRDRLIRIVIFGLTGEVEVHGELYNAVMAPLPYLSDQEVADVLTYVRNSFDNQASAITPEEVKRVRNES